MTDLSRSNSTWRRAAALGLSLAAVAVVGAATLDGGRARFLMKGRADRERLRESLRRFDIRLTDREQRAVREIDARLAEMPEDRRDEYLSTLRRYHDWLHQLPERSRGDVLAEPPESRLKRIRELAVKYPPPDWRPTASMDFIQVGGTGAFELAALCKAWLALSPTDRKAVDGLEVGKRKEELARRGRDHGIPREIRPADFDEAHWMEEAEARIRELREPGAGPRDWLAKIETKFEQNGDDPASTRRVRSFRRRLAENLYVQEHALDHPVDPARLERFFVAIPPWIQSTFSAFPGAEVRHRLGVVYRLLYPFPEEFQPAPPAPAAKPATAPAGKSVGPPRQVPPPAPKAAGPAAPF